MRFLLALIVAVGCLACDRVQKPNRALPESFQAVTLTGDLLDRKELSGRPWVVAVWRPDCAPCARQLKQLDALKSKLSGTAVGFLALSLDDDEDQVIDAAARLEIDSTIALAQSETMGPLSLSALPGFAFVDAHGTVVAAASGDQDDATLARWAKTLADAQ